MNWKPPRLINGILCRASSISRSKEWKLDRNNTAMSQSGTPSSRSSKIFWQTKRDCICSLSAWTRTGVSPSCLWVKSRLS